MWTINVNRLILLSCCLFILPSVLAGPDRDRENEIAENLVEKLTFGEPIWFNKDTSRGFFGIFTETFLGNRQHAVILVHGIGQHPDWPGVISSLRIGLSQEGMTTLSIQMPILAPEDPVAGYGQTIKESQNRLKTVVNYLNEIGFESVSVVGYSFGAAIVANYIVKVKEHGVTSFVGISMLAREFLNPRVELMLLLENTGIPVLDIFGSNDLVEVLDAAPDRRLAARANGTRIYDQLEMIDSDHLYTEKTDELIATILIWLEENNQSPESNLIDVKKPQSVEINDLIE